MKVYSIGREHGCDIFINDNTDVISRRHAVLNVSPSGKMTIVDQSHNGTYVNGIRISPNVPVPVTRKDNVSFAHVARLDWNMVPKGNSFVLRYVTIAAIALIVVIGGVIGYCTLNSGIEKEPNTVAVDTLKTDFMKQEQAKKDSIEKSKKDSVEKAKEKTVSKPKRTVNKKKAEVDNKTEKKVTQNAEKENKEEGSKPKRLR